MHAQTAAININNAVSRFTALITIDATAATNVSISAIHATAPVLLTFSNNNARLVNIVLTSCVAATGVTVAVVAPITGTYTGTNNIFGTTNAACVSTSDILNGMTSITLTGRIFTTTQVGLPVFGSPVIGKLTPGDPADGYAVDLYGFPRFWEGSVDVGAIQHRHESKEFVKRLRNQDMILRGRR